MSDVDMVSCRGDKFDKFIKTAFKDMRVEKDFCDVTLVCGNGNQLLAHKLILSAYSPFFHNLLKRNPHPHPLIYLRGASYADVQAILDYMYMGEANVTRKNVDSFVILAKDLQIKGLEKQYDSPNDLFDIGSNNEPSHSSTKQPGPLVSPKETPLGDSSNKNTSQNISSEKPPQTSFKEKLPQVNSANVFSPRSSSNEEPSQRTTKQPGPQEQTQQKSVGIKRPSSSSVTPPSKSVRTTTRASLIQDLNERSESKTTSGIKQAQGNQTSGQPNLDDTSSGHIDLTGEEAQNNEQDTFNGGWDGMNCEDGSRKSTVASETESSDSANSNSGTAESYGSAADEIRRIEEFLKENLEVNETNYMCKLCMKSFDKRSKWNAGRHIQTVHYGVEKICITCGLIFKNYETLAAHHRKGNCHYQPIYPSNLK